MELFAVYGFRGHSRPVRRTGAAATRAAGLIALSLVTGLVPARTPARAAPPPRAAVGGPGVPAVIGDWPGEELDEGLTLYRGTLGDPSGPGRWTVTVRVPGDRPGELGGRADASELALRLHAAGFDARVEAVPWSGYEGAGDAPLGWRVRVGAYGTRAQAAAQVRRLKSAGYPAGADWTRTDPVEVDPRGGHSARVRVAILDPRRYRGEVTASYGRALALPETTTSMARAAGATLAVNGGYFVLHEEDGLTGTPAGIGVYDGEVESLATNGRAALLLGDRPRVARLFTAMTVVAGRRRREIDGVNRTPGLVRNCGGVGGDSPTQAPRHDVTCTDPSEIVLFTPALGRHTPEGDGVEVVLDGEGRVVERRPRGGPVPDGGRVLAGIGEGAAWLSAYAWPGVRLGVRLRVCDEDGRAVDLGDADVVNGGPWLVRDGRVDVDVVSDGVLYAENPAFFYTWGIKRNPRVMVGIDRWDRLILVTADGRRPGYSDGLSLLEGARFLRELGAVEGINLDGGGSVSLAVRGRLDNRPSDEEGERSVGDALLFLPPPEGKGGGRPAYSGPG
ncbi:phosphodiester glycosidase family protein [Thermopolyspora sp. NPDC052614]|uniref:phosphodiester glycosidase family protein n=1 Tax=Thermopolyspora sp. NPDC052614 TaxID=3155682 RepID=UPI003436DA93